MKIAVIGTGYVGLVAGACFADLGNSVVCVDIDQKKIAMLEGGKIPIYEPGLEEIVRRNCASGRLSFTTGTAKAVRASEIIFIAVGTPEKKDGSADLKYVYSAAQAIGRAVDGPKIVVDKSTVPVGTSKEVEQEIRRYSKHPVHVVSNPEFLREGSAVNDFMQPDRVVIGAREKSAAQKVAQLYYPLKREIIFTSPESAEMIKYASNSFLATKISFINEIAAICEKAGADVLEVANGMGKDPRIGRLFLSAGAGYGGSCFPKDVRELQQTAAGFGYDFGILREAGRVNASQKEAPVKKLKALMPALKGKKVVLFGLAFKPSTDDMRQASSIIIAKMLEGEKAEVVGVDPAASKNASALLPGISLEQDPYKAALGADAIILVTEWNEFLELDYAKIAAGMRAKIIIDARNALDREKLVLLGFKYAGIGR